MADFNSNNIALYNNKKYEILTPDGFKKFDGVLKGTNKLLHTRPNTPLYSKELRTFLRSTAGVFTPGSLKIA